MAHATRVVEDRLLGRIWWDLTLTSELLWTFILVVMLIALRLRSPRLLYVPIVGLLVEIVLSFF